MIRATKASSDRYNQLRVTSAAQFRRMIEEAINSAERGDVKPAEEVFNRLKAKYSAMANSRKGI
jgi:hypothetical protein